ncbi:D-tyrosyl-tRNA(Tyr) deacylase [Archaeoglobales archaeon ex4484_92]|nr:MAG: D-tyrosyl-tRNA(Tyr) deacylase [Archaeoglobales archaeon ex4484_92]
MILVVYSRVDPASSNIGKSLVELIDFDLMKRGDYTFYVSSNMAVAETNENLIFADYIDLKLSKYLEFDEIIFVSRHSSKDGRKIFTAHVSGNVSEAKYGGKPSSLARASPLTIKNYVLALKSRIHTKPEFEFTLEATHHGPSEIQKPSAFFEIGSTENEWRDKEAARIVAESIIDAINSQRRDWLVAVGIGGTHYVPRQTDLILSTKFTFGHNFAKYSYESLNPKIVLRAVSLSNAKYIIYDEKSVNSKIKNLISKVAEEGNLKVMKSKKARREYPLE